MKQITYKWFNKNLSNIFALNSIPLIYYVLSDTLEVHVGNLDDCNIEYCKEHNIPIYNLNRNHGTCVCCDGTIGVALIYDVKHGWIHNEIRKAIVEFLKSQDIGEITENGNEILVNDFKVSSTVSKIPDQNHNIVYTCVLISYDVDLDAIRHICKKEMKKIPKGLKDFGLDKLKLMDWFFTYFTELENKLV